MTFTKLIWQLTYTFSKAASSIFFPQKEWKHISLKRNRGAQVACDLVSLQINMLSFKTDKEFNDVKRKIPKTLQSTRVSISISLIFHQAEDCFFSAATNLYYVKAKVLFCDNKMFN